MSDSITEDEFLTPGGGVLKREEFPALYQAIAKAYGDPPDPIPEFKLPDLTGQSPPETL
jgi:hypothetical protein